LGIGKFFISVMDIIEEFLLAIFTAFSTEENVFWISIAMIVWASFYVVFLFDFKHYKNISAIPVSFWSKFCIDSVCYGLYFFSISNKQSIVAGFFARFLIIIK